VTFSEFVQRGYSGAKEDDSSCLNPTLVELGVCTIKILLIEFFEFRVS